MTSMNNSFKQSLRQQIYSKKVKPPQQSTQADNVVPIQDAPTPQKSPERQAQIDAGLNQLFPSNSTISGQGEAIQQQLFNPQESHQNIPPQVTPLQGFGAYSPQQFPGGALYGQGSKNTHQHTQGATVSEEDASGFFDQLKEAFVDLFFEDIPADQPIGLSQLSSNTFNSTPEKPAGSFYTAPVTEAQDFRFNPFKGF